MTTTITGRAIGLAYAEFPLLWAFVKSGSLGREDAQPLTLMEAHELAHDTLIELERAWPFVKPRQRAAVLGYLCALSAETIKKHGGVKK